MSSLSSQLLPKSPPMSNLPNFYSDFEINQVPTPALSSFNRIPIFPGMPSSLPPLNLREYCGHNIFCSDRFSSDMPISSISVKLKAKMPLSPDFTPFSVQSCSPFRHWVAQVSIVKDSLSSLRNMVHSVEIKESCFSRGLTVKNSTKSGPLRLQQDSDDDGISSSTSIIVPTKLTVGVERLWFDEILDPVGWLLDEHLDALLALAVETFTKAGHAAPEARDYTILDTTCWSALKQDNPTILYKQLIPYVLGESPFNCGMAWKNVKKIYGFSHVRDVHWVCFEISFTDQKITIFDSMSETSHWPSMIYELTDFAFNIPYLLRRTNIQLTADGVECQMKMMWELVQYRHPPQQRNKSDYCIMAVKYIESLLGGTPFASIRPESVKIYRKNYCARLFEYGMQSRGAVRGRVG
ncbi:hypothetical protein C2S53_009583 [Perilla frutescens var. hirtella]|uniref:Ubiquitin-like protease family profile domain-containing protein n=1 Tax=Perilla frutescens var. hirtella TaxID=608512 RepID=A0AAD4JRZ5_PERFH|nr:hypothetical protein C2S53_009583 [Perilla frutescens var. hirtella]